MIVNREKNGMERGWIKKKDRKKSVIFNNTSRTIETNCMAFIFVLSHFFVHCHFKRNFVFDHWFYFFFICISLCMQYGRKKGSVQPKKKKKRENISAKFDLCMEWPQVKMNDEMFFSHSKCVQSIFCLLICMRPKKC